MAGKWINPFPGTSDLGELEIHSTDDEPWLDVEIAGEGRSVARVREIDLKLGSV